MSTATITAMNNLSSIIDDWLSDVITDKPTKPLAIDDPIAAACASYRHGKETGIRWTALSDAVIDEQDRIRAQELRKYYTGRLTFQALKGELLTEFRKKLYSILNNDYIIVEGDQGLIQRLPYFYEEDLATEELIANTVSADRTGTIAQGVVTLTPYKKIFYGRKHGESTQFWWRNKKQQGVVLVIKNDNQLYSLIDSLFTQPRQFEAKYGIGSHHWYNKNHLYYKLLTPSLYE
jgi:hypothetical protein